MREAVSTNISIEKLSAPVEALDIDIRDCRALRRAGLRTVAEILVAGRHTLTSAKRLSSPRADRILEALKAHLGLPGDDQVDEPPAQRGSPSGPLAASLEVLQLPGPSLQRLRSMGLFRVVDLLSSRPNGYGNLLGLEEAEIRAIDIRLDSYLVSSAYARLQGPAAGGETAPAPAVPPKMNLGSVLQALALGERDWSVLELRSWSSVRLEGLGARVGGIRRDHPRKILARARDVVQDRLLFLSSFLDLFEQKSRILRGELEDRCPDRDAVIRGLLPDPLDPCLTASPEDVERTITLVRAVAMSPSPWFSRELEPRWPAFVFLSCLIEPAIQRHPAVSETVGEWKRAKKRKTCRELVYEVLAERGEPMHWRDAAEAVWLLNPGRPVATGYVHACLNQHRELFVLRGTGTYGLAEWGHPAVGTYPQVIARVLRQEGRPLSLSVLFERVSAIRAVKKSSLKMNLRMHPRFYRTMDPPGTYGLRGWLLDHPGEEARGTPPPGWLVEHPTSAKRMERAKARQLGLDKMLREDMLA